MSISYFRLEEMLCQIEQKHGVAQRWHTDDEVFQLARNDANDRQTKAGLCKVQTRVVEHWFLLNLKAKYAGKCQLSFVFFPTNKKIQTTLVATTTAFQYRH